MTTEGDVSTTVPHEPGVRPVTPPTAERTRRRRRPSGAPPPLPKHIGTTGTGWIVAVVVLSGWLILGSISDRVIRFTNRVDAALLRQIARLRTEWLTDVTRAIDAAVSYWTVIVLFVVLGFVLIALRRWRHFFTFLACMAVLQLVGEPLWEAVARPRPFDVTIIGEWEGFSLPPPVLAFLTLLVVAIAYTLVVPGRPRTIAKVAGGVVIGVYAAAELYLATVHPFDVAIGVTMAVALGITAFRLFTPSEIFPVAYGGGKKAHLDVGGERGEAIRKALQDQLGLTVIDLKPVGLAGSGGSTPLRLRVAGDPDTYLFGKLYAMSHVRADRWYKLGRTVIYGRLEDEAPFSSVRRLVQYEDYTLRLFCDYGILTAAPYGIVELTPEREYLLVTEFFDGAREIGDPELEVDDEIIDGGLLLIRTLWDAGLAHRDIKPANILVRDKRVLVIDVAFAQVRPSPWRQAIDLANMMLVLAVRTDSQRVYDRALQFFTPDEIAEAFAAARGVASPSQLRSVMKQDGRDLIGEFRALAPARQPIALQRWSTKRVLTIAALAAGAAIVISALTSVLAPGNANTAEISKSPSCGTSNIMILMAQTVPTATSVPCVANLPAGWSVGGTEVESDEGRFWLDSALAGKHAVEATLRPPEACTTEGATEVPSDEVGMRRFERPEQLTPDLVTTRYYTFEGGCVIYEFSFGGDASTALLFEADTALSFQSRVVLVDDVGRRTNGLSLCGALAPPCPGGP
ncbi:MAG: hypothetical protein EHM63_02955 [Actinobacteria bacterium]|nr:MAG: hypothetical protein EHM63_02955 [Actinomycetota bacterium]